MGEQHDPDMDNAEGRGFPRIYDGAKRSLLDDVRGILDRLSRADTDGIAAGDVDAARALLKRIDGGER